MHTEYSRGPAVFQGVSGQKPNSYDAGGESCISLVRWHVSDISKARAGTARKGSAISRPQSPSRDPIRLPGFTTGIYRPDDRALAYTRAHGIWREESHIDCWLGSNPPQSIANRHIVSGRNQRRGCEDWFEDGTGELLPGRISLSATLHWIM